MVDEYIWGSVSRISPEAPVPVVLEKDREHRPGGALNVINNLIALQATPYITGIIGTDEGGRFVSNFLEENDIDIDGIIKVPEISTTQKTRIIGNSQQIVRLDFERSDPIEANFTEEMLDYIDSKMEYIDGIIISDYNKGVINSNVLKKLQDLRYKGFFIAIDPHVRQFKNYFGMSLVTPNHHEAGEGIGIKIVDEESLRKVSKEIINEMGHELLLITLGENGMVLCKGDGSYTHIPTVAKHVYDVTGAGDTVITVFTLSILSDATPEEAAILSNIAAGYVVGKIGTVIIPLQDLQARIISEYILL